MRHLGWIVLVVGLSACAGWQEAPLDEIGVAETETYGLGEGECYAYEDGECISVLGEDLTPSRSNSVPPAGAD